MIRKILVLFSTLAFVLSVGCTSKEKQTESRSTKPLSTSTSNNIDKPKREPTQVEKLLLQPPGKYSGQNYNEEKVKKELDKLPNNLTTQQYYDAFLKLVAEDYRPHVTTFINFDTSIQVNHAQPTKDITLPSSKKVHFSLLLDASGSMNEKIGSETKMDIAKKAIQQFAQKLPKNASLSLRVYGHKGSNQEQDKKTSCASTEEIYQAVGYEQSSFQNALDSVKASGWTPIAKALQNVKQDIPKNSTESIVYVVSDGIETCGGNPVKAAELLSQANVKTVVNIIGFKIDDQGQKMLKEVAEAGNGEYTDVQDEQSLKKYLDNQYSQLLDEWDKWQSKGLKEANKIQDQKLKLANETQDKMMKLNNIEQKHLTAARKYLEKKFDQYDHPVNKTFDLIYKRDSIVFKYAYEVGNKLWNRAYENGNKEWNRIYEKGNKEWSNVYEEKNKQ
ncbi:VWA domain-containing protein [Thermoflavimicrobium daqui]|uniref:Amino acid dehydrogenase n=1 Tax=Thermoflavimicrobium daqui TaxID=2137476 RepID=A0A364K0U2_9BACL|nr:VWA domain-containing protein [Thermoflavimicrobium daqui]RAL21306.1 amino acid dehydrogenase [Thermoflavimicrobium daqui]